MNIFVLDENPIYAAKYHCDKHVVKMLLETAQLASTAVYLYSDDDLPDFYYKPTHENHPCGLWARETQGNFAWLYLLGIGLCVEYTRRYGKEHKSSTIIRDMIFQLHHMPAGDQTPFALAMPDKYKVTGDAVQSYRNYYIGEKKDFAKWKTGEIPEWFERVLVANG